MPDTMTTQAGRKEILGWAMYDFANSGYTTVVLTAVYSAYFVGVIADGTENGQATFLWTIAIAIANALVLFSAPIVGAIADHSATKKKLLAFTTLGCVSFTALLGLTGPGDIILAMLFIILSSMMFYSGENLIAAFLPELSSPEKMGRVSAFGWTIGYLGGLLVLGLCLYYVTQAQAKGQTAEQFVPITMYIVAACFALASLPTFLWVKERANPEKAANINYLKAGFQRLQHSWQHARRYQDLIRFLLALTVFYCGINTVVVLAAVYAQEVMGFTTTDTITLILVVNITAAIGAFIFGQIQDRIGAIRTLSITLFIWILAMVIAYFTEQRSTFWIVANLVGIALGSSQSAGRAIVGLFSPTHRSGEFFGLWGLATKLSAVIGPLVYGLITQLSQGDHRLALISTSVFFILGLILLAGVNEQRGRVAAQIHD